MIHWQPLGTVWKPIAGATLDTAELLKRMFPSDSAILHLGEYDLPRLRSANQPGFVALVDVIEKHGAVRVRLE